MFPNPLPFHAEMPAQQRTKMAVFANGFVVAAEHEF